MIFILEGSLESAGDRHNEERVACPVYVLHLLEVRPASTVMRELVDRPTENLDDFQHS